MKPFLFGLAVWLASSAALAQQCPVIAGGKSALSQRDARERLEFLRTALREDGRRARVWWDAWLGGYSGLTALFLAPAIAGTVTPNPPASSPIAKSDAVVLPQLRTNRYVLYDSAATSFIGLVSVLVAPPHSAFDGAAFDHKLTQPWPSDICVLVAEGEKMLLRDAGDEAFGTGILEQIGNVGLNVAAGLIIGILLKQWVQAAITTVVGVGIGEAMILTEPVGSISALKAYREGVLTPVEPPKAELFTQGATLVLRF